LDFIEVVDNGCGIKPEDWEGVGSCYSSLLLRHTLNASQILHPNTHHPPFTALKHHTSKFSSSSGPSSDLSLTDVSTFGFRGEALSSLCALAGEVVITTATTSMSGLGVKLTFNRDGVLIRPRSGGGGGGTDLERIARQRGTTVLVSNLFQPFPVRKKEFERTAKREFAKALGVCLAYALVPAVEARNQGGGSVGVRLTVDSISSTGSV
jgi:DNA mismatch repair protein PMS2